MPAIQAQIVSYECLKQFFSRLKKYLDIAALINTTYLEYFPLLSA